MKSSLLERMQTIGMPLLVHGEVVSPDIDIFDREAVFLETVLTPEPRPACLRDGPSFGALLWATVISLAALAVAFTLSWRPSWLRWPFQKMP